MLVPVRTVPPTETPISLEDAKAHLRVDITDEDDLIAALIASATEYVEVSTGKALIEQTWEQSFGTFGGELRLPREPVSSIESITYIDGDGAEQTIVGDTYRVLTDILGPKVVLVPGNSWPVSYDREDAVTIAFVAGYGAAEDVPMPLRQAVKLLVGHWYENREPTAGAAMSGLWQEIPLTASALIEPYRRKKF